jgi:hypothetical protein
MARHALVFVCFFFLLTLLVDGSGLVWRVRVVGVGRVPHLSITLVNHSTTRSTILARDLAIRGLVSDGGKLRADTTTVSRRLSLGGVGAGAIDLASLCLSGHTLTVLGSLARSFFFLLASLPFLANLLEF